MKEALAQPEQEPVAKLLLQSKQNYVCNFGPSATADWIYSDLLELLKAPPKRTWVGLTAEEAAECWTTSASKTWHNLEANLKEKNA